MLLSYLVTGKDVVAALTHKVFEGSLFALCYCKVWGKIWNDILYRLGVGFCGRKETHWGHQNLKAQNWNFDFWFNNWNIDTDFDSNIISCRPRLPKPAARTGRCISYQILYGWNSSTSLAHFVVGKLGVLKINMLGTKLWLTNTINSLTLIVSHSRNVTLLPNLIITGPSARKHLSK